MTTLGADDLDLVRRRVINVVGHELRTPLTTIRGLAELMSTASDEELRETLIPTLVRNARRAERLLDDLLIAGGVSTAHPVDAGTELDLEPLVAEAVAGTAVEVVGHPDGPVHARREKVSHALGHLVDNANRYCVSPPTLEFDSDAETITVILRTPVDSVVSNLELGFELFFRGEVAVTTSPGLGVGLPVARALARLDGGDVHIEQTDGVVVTRLTLPRPS